MTQCRDLPPRSTAGKDPDLRLAEANHRIANNLSLLSAVLRRQAGDIAQGRGRLSRPQAERLLMEASARVAAVGSFHALLGKRPQAAMVDIGDHLRQTCEALLESYAGAACIEFSHSFATASLVPAERVVPLTLIVTELMTNAVKYAHPTGIAGQLSLTGSREADCSLVIELADDGVGLPEGFNPATDGGFGLQLARLLAGQIGATLTFRSTSFGLQVQLRVHAAPIRPKGAEPVSRK